MTTTTPHRQLAEPFSTGASWLARAVVVSALLHLALAVAWWLTTRPASPPVELVDIELAPPPPAVEALPEEHAKPPEQVAAAQAASAAEPSEPDEEGMAPGDAGVDAPIDAPIDAPRKKKRRADAGVDADVPLVADVDDAGTGADDGATVAIDLADGGVIDPTGDAGAQVAMVDPGASAGSGVPGATTESKDAGVPGVDNQPAVEGAPTSAGTAANLLAYFPPGHVVTVLVRFDRLRKTEWAAPAARLFQPMPDYRALFGGRTVALADDLDMLVISSPRPRDATATTLVGHTQLSRAQMRDFLANPDAPIEWKAAKGGMLGRRSSTLIPNDKRVLLSPWRGWFVLAPPQDLPGLTAAAKGNLDRIEARGKLPPWLATIRTIEQETTQPAPPGATPPADDRGPALVLTLAGPSKRYRFPDVGLGVTSAPSPQRVSLAMELVKQGWLVRGNIVFASETDAAEFVQIVQGARQRITDSHIFSALLKKQHALNAITGLSVARTGARVSYATSISIADARALLEVAAQTLDAYFANPP